MINLSGQSSSVISIGSRIRSGTPGSVLFVGISGLLAQDNSNLFWDDVNNRFGIGTNAPTAVFEINANTGTLSSGAGIHFRITGADATQPIGFLESYANNGFIGFRRANGTLASPTQLITDSKIGAFGGGGYHSGGAFSGTRVSVSFWANEAWTATAQGSYITFNTTLSGATTAGGREILRGTDAGNIKIANTNASPTVVRGTTEGTNHLDIFDGTAPVGTLTNGVSFYSEAGEAKVMDAAGNATLLSPHDRETNEWIFFSKNTVTGKVLIIDMERMMKLIDKALGGGFVKEYVEAISG